MNDLYNSPPIRRLLDGAASQAIVTKASIATCHCVIDTGCCVCIRCVHQMEGQIERFAH